MKRWTIFAAILGFVLSAAAQFSPVQMEVRPLISKKDTSVGYSNQATFTHTRALRITLKNTSPQPVSGITVRWGVVKIGQDTYRPMPPTAFGEEQTVDLKGLESKVIETAAVQASGRRWNYLAPEGEKIVGHGVQVLVGGKVVAEEFTPPSYKKCFEKIKPVQSGQEDADNTRRRSN